MKLLSVETQAEFDCLNTLNKGLSLFNLNIINKHSREKINLVYIKAWIALQNLNKQTFETNYKLGWRLFIELGSYAVRCKAV
jgi:hypothetical protein